MIKKYLFVSFISFLSVSLFAADSLKIVSPVTNIVYQRDNDNKAVIQVKGICPSHTTSIEARLVARSKGQGVSTGWIKIAGNISGDTFSGVITAQAGWYNLEVCARNKNKKIAVSTIDRVGIGEVFIIVGHSVAQGGDINIEGSSDERAITIAANNKSDEFNNYYLKTGDPKYLPAPKFTQAATGVALAPFGSNSYFWSKFAEYVVKKINLPVLIYNAAFGGTSLEHWAKSSQGIQFEHGFVKSAIRMPYINLYNTLNKYIPLTGVRAILADQGQNDAGQKSADTIFANYKTFVQQARNDLGFPGLTVVVNQQTPANSPQVRIAQERMIKESYSFPGPDYDKVLLKEDRYDGIHLSESGLRKAAVLWADALTPGFYKTVVPWMPSFK